MQLYLILSAAALALIVAIRYRHIVRNVRRAEADFPPEGQFLSLEGRRLHYVRRGCVGQKPAVLLLHGSDGFLQDFASLLQEEAADDFDMIASGPFRPPATLRGSSSAGGTLLERCPLSLLCNGVP